MELHNLKQLRINRGLRQVDVSEFLGVDRTTYVKYENGSSEPDLLTLKTLAEFFETTTSFLIGETNDPVPRNVELIIPEELKDVPVAFNRGEFEDLTQDEVDKLAEFARFIKSQRQE